MAKKKKKKDDGKKKFEYSNEVIGIILILASVIGIGAYGPAGNFIRAFAIFLVGNIYIFLLKVIKYILKIQGLELLSNYANYRIY